MEYFDNVATETDVWLSVATGGPPGETISLRAARAAATKHAPMACLLCKWLSLTVETDHCQKQLAGTASKPAAALRAGLQLAAVIGGLWVLMHLLF